MQKDMRETRQIDYFYTMLVPIAFMRLYEKMYLKDSPIKKFEKP